MPDHAAGAGATPQWVARHLLVLAVFAALACVAVSLISSATFFPQGVDSTKEVGGWETPPPSFRELTWIACQSFWLTMPGLMVSFAFRRRPRAALIAGSISILICPLLMLLDAVTFRWIGDRFLSLAMWRVATELRQGLIGYVSNPMLVSATFLMIIAFVVLWLIFWSSKLVSRRWYGNAALPGPRGAMAVAMLSTVALALPSLLTMQRTRQTMAANSFRHPLCVIGLVGFSDPGGKVPDSVAVPINSLERAVQKRERRQRLLSINTEHQVSGAKRSPDILVVVVESLRREMVTPEVMPNLWRFAEEGLHCRSHFSGGNATNHGMFSLFNGLEAIWYERPVKFSPLMNRLFRSAGYETGFFAGCDGWREFYMDGFVSAEHFDVFHTSKPKGLVTDRSATQRASLFLDRQDGPEQDGSESERPRLAVLYLYATHATYTSYPDDQVFQPAADDRLLYPYTESAQPSVWNRYKNSARTVDRFLGAVMRDDRVVVVTGDHGEAFLEDGTIGHGIRISEYQNMTPAIVFVPGQEKRVIEAPTSHADVLPTLLAAVGIRLTDPQAIDGINLLSANSNTLAERVLSTRNYLESDVALIGPWTHRENDPFAFRVAVDLATMESGFLGAIDNRGYQSEHDASTDGEAAFRQWTRSRFGL